MTNLEAVQELYRLFAARDHGGIRRLLAPDVEWNQMAGCPHGGRYVGPDAVLTGVFAGFREQWVEWRAPVERYLDAGDTIIALGHYAGTFRATGCSMRAEFAHVYTLEGGRIVRFAQYTDTRRIADAMGLGPATGTPRG